MTFTVSDDDSPLASLVVSAASTNQDVVPDAKLTLTLGDSTGVLAGVYGWRLQQTGGPTRLSGSVHVVAS
jgi:hypothetical protein